MEKSRVSQNLFSQNSEPIPVDSLKGLMHEKLFASSSTKDGTHLLLSWWDVSVDDIGACGERQQSSDWRSGPH